MQLFFLLLLSSSVIPTFFCADPAFEKMTKQARAVLLNPKVDQGTVDKVTTEIHNRMCNKKQTLTQLIHEFPQVIQGRTSPALTVTAMKAFRDLSPCYKNSGSDSETQFKKLGEGLNICMDKTYKEAQKLCGNPTKHFDYLRKELTAPKVKKCFEAIKKQQIGTPCPKCFQCTKEHGGEIYKFPAGV